MWQGFDMYGLIWYVNQYSTLMPINTIDWQGNEITHTTVGTVCATTLLGCLVYLDVLDDQVAGVETLGVCVGFGILEETK